MTEPRPLTEEERQAIRAWAEYLEGEERYVEEADSIDVHLIARLLDLLEQSERLAKNASETLQSTIARLEQSEARAVRALEALGTIRRALDQSGTEG